VILAFVPERQSATGAGSRGFALNVLVPRRGRDLKYLEEAGLAEKPGKGDKSYEL